MSSSPSSSSTIPSQSKTWLLAQKPSGDPILSADRPDATFKLAIKDLPSSLGPNQILIKIHYISNDPAQRGWIDPNIPPERLYVPPVEVGTTMRARGLGEVVRVGDGNQKFKVGDWVLGSFGWNEYVVVDDEDHGKMGIRPTPDLPGGLSRTHYLGALGSTGLTAYYGLVVISEAKKGERVLVSGAAGATGSMVVQIAKRIVGASYVVGIAGTDEKCRWVESLGADKCLNYKSSSFKEDLKDAAGDGFDIYYDNVGGDILDMALLHMRKHGRIAACGAVSAYNSGNAWTSKNFFQIITMRLQIKGFIIFDFMPRAPEAIEVMRKSLQEGKLKIGDDNETVVPTKFEDVPKTWAMLFEGGNQGKLITKL